MVCAFVVSCAQPPRPIAPAPAPVTVTVTAPTPSDREESPRGVRVILEGNALVPSAELLPVLLVDKPDAAGLHGQDLLDRDVLWLTVAYLDRGFLDVRIEPPVFARAPDGPFVDVRFSIHEGVRYRIRKLTVSEHDASGKEIVPLGTKKLRERLLLHEGDVFARDVFVRDVSAIQKLYRDASYAHVDTDVKTDLDPARAEVDVTLIVRRNEPSVIDRIVVAGNHAVKSETIRSAVGIADGERWSDTRLIEAKARLLGLGLFKRVDISSVDKPSKSRMTVTFEVEEN